jgi:putative ABC transport system permease protein
MRGVLSDCRYALRLLAQTPLTSALAIGALAIAIGIVNSLLSLYVDLQFRPHAGYEDSGRLVTLGQSDGETLTGLPFALMERMAEEMTSIAAIAGSSPGRLLVSDAGDEIGVELVSRGFFDGLRPRLYAGRGFEPDEHRRDGERVAVVSYRYWQDALGGADVLDTMLVVDWQPNALTAQTATRPPEFRIVGILAEEASGFVEDAAIWLPFEQALALDNVGSPEFLEMQARSAMMSVLARRAEGTSTEGVFAEMRARYSEVTGAYGFMLGRFPAAADGLIVDIGVLRESKQQLLMLLAASVLLALVAAANVSLFLMARAPARRRELGVRMAVGAPLGRLGRQLATEAATLVLIASALGLAISYWAGQLLRGSALLRQTRWNDVALLDARVLGTLAALLILLAVLVSLAPVLGLKRVGIGAASRTVRARTTPVQRIAGSVQIAIAGMLGGAAIAFGWHMTALLFDDPGFEIDDRYVVETQYNLAQRLQRDPSFASRDVEARRISERIAAIPGVSAITFGYPVPGQVFPMQSFIRRPDNPNEFLYPEAGAIDAGYLDVLGLRLLRGRAPTEADADSVLVNQALAREIWGHDDVVGEIVGMGGSTSFAVIGVLEDVSFGHPLAEAAPRIFGVRDLGPWGRAIVVSTLTAGELEQECRRAVAGGDLEFRVSRVRSLAELRAELIGPDRARSLLTVGAASLVVLLAALGFYGTERYLVASGRREYAIRASLGAGPKSIARLVLLRASTLGLPGLLAGALLTFTTVAWLRADYVSREVSPGAVTLAVVLGLAALLFAASLGPTLSAARTQPAPLLRED